MSNHSRVTAFVHDIFNPGATDSYRIRGALDDFRRLEAENPDHPDLVRYQPIVRCMQDIDRMESSGEWDQALNHRTRAELEAFHEGERDIQRSRLRDACEAHLEAIRRGRMRS